MALNTENPNHLLIGLGGTGGLILKAFKKRLYGEFDESQRKDIPQAIEFLYVDSTIDDLMNYNDPSWRVNGKKICFETNEFLNIRSGQSISSILDSLSSHPELKYIVRNGEAMRQTIGEIATAAGQKRRAGRIMFACKCREFMNSVAMKYTTLQNKTNKSTLHIHVFTGLAGGTGSGAIIDVAAQLRKAYPSAELDIYAMVPERNIPQGFDAGGRYHPNGYVALMELNALNVGRFLPSDVLTGDEHIQLDTSLKKQFGMILFTNVNSHGDYVDSRKELPGLVSDAVYTRIFLNKTEASNEFFRTWSCENGDDFIEFDIKSKDKDLIRARTKAVGSFGIKRISYPEQRVREHISYTVAEKLVAQMRYNNFDQELGGYVDEPRKKDYSEYTSNEPNLIRWKLDEKHLMLEKKILESDNNGKALEDFNTFWSNQVLGYSYEDAKSNNPSDPIGDLENFCSHIFKTTFRKKCGVADYFREKGMDQPLREQVAEIVDGVEKDLFDKWKAGEYSMYDLERICDTIISYVDECKRKGPGLVDKNATTVSAIETERAGNLHEYNDTGYLSGHLFKKSAKIYSNHQELLVSYYIEKTKQEALGFREKLLILLKSEFEDFRSEITEFVGKLAKSQDVLIKAIVDRTRKDDGRSEHDMTIEIYEQQKMRDFEKRIASNSQPMNSLAKIMRDKLTAFAPSSIHFSDISKFLTDSTITDLADIDIAPQLEAMHDADSICRKDKILGINVLQLLKKTYEDEEALSSFARRIGQSCGVFLTLSNLNSSCGGKNVKPEASLRKTVLISMPKADGDNSLKAFAGELQSAFSKSFDPSMSVQFDDKSPWKNEIVIMEVWNCFPIRCIDSLSLFKKEYDAKMNSDDAAVRVQNRILFHSEEADLPSLEEESTQKTAEEALSLLFVAAALGIVEYAIDNQEYEGWSIIRKDKWGSKIVKNISETFTGFLVSDKLTEEEKEEIFSDTEKKLKEEVINLKKSEKQALSDNIVDVMRNYVVKECSNTSQMYQSYGSAAEKAMEMVTK